ncbi:helix-turn-helix domain-containing protein [bacterium]|nr:helix-turn-helix domain-containing protein [bacterium]
MVALGEALRARRVELGMTQYELARRCGMHRTYVAAVERGERNISILTLLRITDALESTPGDVLA